MLVLLLFMMFCLVLSFCFGFVLICLDCLRMLVGLLLGFLCFSDWLFGFACMVVLGFLILDRCFCGLVILVVCLTMVVWLKFDGFSIYCLVVLVACRLVLWVCYLLHFCSIVLVYCFSVFLGFVIWVLSLRLWFASVSFMQNGNFCVLGGWCFGTWVFFGFVAFVVVCFLLD